MPKKLLPYFTSGVVVNGFGRGSKDLGIPTANFGPEVINTLPHDLKTGVYYGWASVNDGAVHKMVMNIGWNPYFKNKEKSMETHIMETFPDDFYGKMLRVCILGYLRPEMDFNSLDELIKAIQNDIKTADQLLNEPDLQKYKTHSFFIATNGVCLQNDN